MELFKTDDIDLYEKERFRRKKIYEDLCAEPVPEDQKLVYERIQRLDQAYLDYQDRVIFEV